VVKVVYDVLPIDVEGIEEKNDDFLIDILDQEFEFKVFWNQEEEYFSFDLYKDEELLLSGKKITYGIDMLAPVVSYGLDKIRIIPLDKTGEAEKTGITFDNFMSSVLPVVVLGE
jgi:aryl carrier-like protein